MAERGPLVRFGPVDIPILAPEHLIVCKAVFDRPKDWLDIEEMLAWGTEVDAPWRSAGWARSSAPRPSSTPASPGCWPLS